MKSHLPLEVYARKLQPFHHYFQVLEPSCNVAGCSKLYRDNNGSWIMQVHSGVSRSIATHTPRHPLLCQVLWRYQLWVRVVRWYFHRWHQARRNGPWDVWLIRWTTHLKISHGSSELSSYQTSLQKISGMPYCHVTRKFVVGGPDVASVN